MIERLVIHRFRGIREGVLDDLGKVNLLIGPNNSGKTTILEMLYLGGTSGRPCELILENVQDGVYPAAASLPYDFLGFQSLPRLRQRHGHKDRWEESPATLTEEGGLAIALHALPDAHPLRDFRLAAPLPEPGQKDKASFYKKDLSAVALFSLDRQKGIPSAMVPSDFAKHHIRSEASRWHYLWQPEWIYDGERQEPLDHLAVWAEEGASPALRHVLFFDFHTISDHFIDRFHKWAYQNIPDWHEKIAHSLARVFPTLQGAIVEVADAPDGQKGRTGYLRFPGRTPLSIDQFGDGSRHAFKVLASLLALAEVVDREQPGLFLWEDPELFMHPDALGRMLSEVIHLIQDKPIQVFLSTQSLEVVGLLTHHFRPRDPEFQEALRAFRLQLDAGHLYAATFHFQNLYTWLEQGMDPRYWGVVDLPISYRYREAEKLLSEEEL